MKRKKYDIQGNLPIDYIPYWEHNPDMGMIWDEFSRIVKEGHKNMHEALIVQDCIGVFIDDPRLPDLINGTRHVHIANHILMERERKSKKASQIDK